jgi:CPA1 family monovalent cation:H+ antiporter
MTLFAGFSILIVLSTVFAYINYRFIKLPSSIGLMLLALIFSLLLVGLGKLYPSALVNIEKLLNTIDFSELLLGSMLCFMLFAGAIPMRMEDLKPEWFFILIFSTFSVVLSTFIVGISIYYLLILFNIPVAFIYCLLFGSLISPTDPIAVLGILKECKIPKSLETKIAGESLFNDGVAVVIFLTILSVAKEPEKFAWTDVAILFAREAIGGIICGIVIGYLGFRLLRSIDNYKIEVLITLSIAMGGYSLANFLDISGPLTVVVAGIIIGNHGKKIAFSETTAEYIEKFWELTDEILNAMLFVLIGLELFVVNFPPTYIIIGCISIIILLLSRYVSVLLPAQIVKVKEKISKSTILLLTWGGLRGGISIALALSLKPEMQKNLWVTLTYFIVAFSILVQGLTVGKLARRLK